MLIEIEPESLTRVCDAALRSAGVGALLDVNKIYFAVTQATAKSKSDLEAKKNDGTKAGISTDNPKLAE